MKLFKKIMGVILVWFFWMFSWQVVHACEPGQIELNTDIPWVGKCIDAKQAPNAFSTVMGALMKILLNATVAIAFLSLIAAGIMYSLSGANQNIAWEWKELLKKVILWIVLIGLSGLILHTINPNFFKLVYVEISLIN